VIKKSNKLKHLKNARIVLEASCSVKKNEVVAILTHGARRGAGPNTSDARVLASVAAQIGAYPVIIDISEYANMPSYKNGDGLESVRVALQKADVVIGCFTDYKYLGLGKLQSADVYHTGEHRWMALQSHMDQWDITASEIATISKRTAWLQEQLNNSQEIKVISEAGTDFTFSPMRYTPVLAIIPNYGEIAITPLQGSENGIFIIDGPTQMGVRPNNELDREPLRIIVESGIVKDYSGDIVQIERLSKFINSKSPSACYIDEVGIPTTRVKANNMCWSDGTHSTETIHIAIGNNKLRDDLIHGPLHMDGEIMNPTIIVDGKTILNNGNFVD